MSQQRRMRAELNQGVHQFLMQLYHSYKESMGHEESVGQILEVLQSQHEYFSGETISTGGTVDELRMMAKDFESKAKASTVYEEEMIHYEKAVALYNAIEILEKERGN